MKGALDFIANNDILGFGMEEWHKRFIENPEDTGALCHQKSATSQTVIIKNINQEI